MENADIFAEFLHLDFNESVKNSKFPSVLEKANIPVFKKGQKECKKYYRPVIIFFMSKVFE